MAALTNPTHSNFPFFIVLTVFLILASTTTLLRYVVRGATTRRLRWDDWLMGMALACFVWFYVTSLIKIHYASGQHRWELTNEEAEKGYLLWYLAYIAYGLTVTFARLSIGLFFIRITSRWAHRVAIYISMFVTTAVSIIFSCVIIFQCAPVHFYWTRVYPANANNGRCIDEDLFVRLGFTYSTVGAICDLIFFFLPFHLVWTAKNMSRRQKFTLAPLLALAGFGGCAPLVRMAYLTTLSSPDFFYATLFIGVWSTVEMGIAITCGSLITLRPVLALLTPAPSQTCEMHTSHRRPWRIYGSMTSMGGFERGADRMWTRFREGEKEKSGNRSQRRSQMIDLRSIDSATPESSRSGKQGRPTKPVLDTGCKFCRTEIRKQTRISQKLEVDWRHADEADDVEQLNTAVSESWTKFWDKKPGAVPSVPRILMREELGLRSIDSGDSGGSRHEDPDDQRGRDVEEGSSRIRKI